MRSNRAKSALQDANDRLEASEALIKQHCLSGDYQAERIRHLEAKLKEAQRG